MPLAGLPHKMLSRRIPSLPLWAAWMLKSDFGNILCEKKVSLGLEKYARWGSVPGGCHHSSSRDGEGVSDGRSETV